MQALPRRGELVLASAGSRPPDGGGGIGAPYTLPGNADFSDGFHTWAAEWNSRGITCSLGGRTVFSLDGDQVEQTRGPWIFGHPHCVILNPAVGGDWAGPDGRRHLLSLPGARRLRAGLSAAPSRPAFAKLPADSARPRGQPGTSASRRGHAPLSGSCSPHRPAPAGSRPFTPDARKEVRCADIPSIRTHS